ncbi:MAG TPA: hypothetical protein VHR72_00080, partial [Gemmataceae bacterium]|nr:hypothetical protein [Gemmataceae bacterium]
AYLHKFIADCMPASIVRPGADAQEAPKPTEAIVACNKCGQRLRLPAISDEIRVTCPSCSFKFDYETGKRA